MKPSKILDYIGSSRLALSLLLRVDISFYNGPLLDGYRFYLSPRFLNYTKSESTYPCLGENK